MWQSKHHMKWNNNENESGNKQWNNNNNNENVRNEIIIMKYNEKKM